MKPGTLRRLQAILDERDETRREALFQRLSLSLQFKYIDMKAQRTAALEAFCAALIGGGPRGVE